MAEENSNFEVIVEFRVLPGFFGIGLGTKKILKRFTLYPPYERKPLKERSSSSSPPEWASQLKSCIKAWEEGCDGEPAYPWLLATICGLNSLRKGNFTPWQRRVYNQLLRIPRGETRTYGEIAALLGVEGGARAVARACAQNPLQLLIPCHRVVARTGPGGYSGIGGVAIKVLLLSHERFWLSPRRDPNAG